MGDTKYNIEINWYDPPKDMDIAPDSGEKLKNKEDGPIITKCMTDLFKVGGYLPEKEWKAVGKAIEPISNGILEIYGKQLNEKNIIRESHSTGASNRPGGLYVMQDNGSTGVVADPIFIITPGSILDPAGKTKTGAILILSGKATTLPKSNTDYLGFTACITQPISFSQTPQHYIVNIPTNLTTINGGLIRGVFDKTTYKPYITEENESRFFQGNPIKNRLIKEAITRINSKPTNPIVEQLKHEIMAHILMKELGDTLQVEWLKYLYTLGQAQLSTASDGQIQNKITPANSVVITSDAIVRLRAVVNRIPVIFSDMKGKSTYICPNSGAGDATMNQAFISAMLKDLNTQNKNIIDIFNAVIKEGRDLIEEGEYMWLGNSWKQKTILKGIELLEQVRNGLILFIQDINVRIRSLTDIEQAKKLIEYNTLISPFVKTKDGSHKIIKTVTYLLPGRRLRFTANCFVATKINNFSLIIESSKTVPISQLQGGGIQEGGVDLQLENLGIDSLVILNAAVQAAGASMQYVRASSQPEIDTFLKGIESSWDTPVAVPVLQEAMRLINELSINSIKQAVNNPDIYLNEIERINILNNNVFASLDYAMFYCLVKEYHPEIFTYARFVASLIDPSDNLCNEGFGKMYYTTEDSYWWRESDNLFYRNPQYEGVEKKVYMTLNSDTLRAVMYTKAFVNNFPNFNTSTLLTFILKVYTNYDVLHGKADVSVEFGKLFTDEMQKGGEISEIESAANQAIELYEPYYSLLLQKNYSPDLALDHMINEHLDIIVTFDLSIPDEYKDDPDYKKSRKNILQLMIAKLASLPMVAKYIPRSQQHVRSFYEAHGNRIPSRTINDLLMALSVHENKQSDRIGKRERPINLVNEVHGGRFSKLRITRKTRRSKQRQRTTHINRKKSKLKKQN